MTFEEIRSFYETKGGDWIFDLVLQKVLEWYGDTIPNWGYWLRLLDSFSKDQIHFENQIKEFGRELAERHCNGHLKKIEEAYSKVIADFSDANSKETEEIYLELFGLLSDKKRGTEAYYDEFKAFYQSVKSEKIIEANLCLKFHLELKKRLFVDNPPPSVATSAVMKEPSKKQKKALDLLVKHLGSGHKLENSKELAAKDAGYTGTRQVHNLYKDVENGVLKHEELIGIINKNRESISG